MKIRELVTVGKEIELKYTTSGTAMAKTSIAVSRNEKKADKWEKVTDWYNLVAFSKTAERLSQFVQKGHRILIDGTLKQNSYVDKENNKKIDYSITLDEFTFIEKSDKGNSQSNSYQKPQQKQYEAPNIDIDDDTIPF